MPKATYPTGTLTTSLAAHEVQTIRWALALRLINTETIDRGKRQDALASPDDLARWWDRACERCPDECAVARASDPISWTSELLVAVKVLRRALRALATQVVEHLAVEEKDLNTINAILARGYTALEITEQGTVKTVVRSHTPEQSSVLLPIALSGLRLFTESDWRRLHQCQHDRCIVFFYDSTKSGTRRWCSPECMNRARSIRHYQLMKKKTEELS